MLSMPLCAVDGEMYSLWYLLREVRCREDGEHYNQLGYSNTPVFSRFPK
ncbi:hypothetical protein CRENPOLYSF1_10043 [Crenothrix polyspora]|uniref:Uncharacterized protein n=1 Tax=Crenothrix polyspora TaxID=360316 RepID=A0A1R4GZ03_9GAMM|nr:hypothetical protein CRENPOLYSF1_10043 [Crenothrix polyspora]